jgi:hypothetical protein
MKTLLSKLTVGFLFLSALFFTACDKNCPLPDDCDCSGPIVDPTAPAVYLAYLNSLSRVLYAVPGYEKPFLDAFHAKQLGTSEFFLPPTSTFPEGMKFTMLLSDIETVSEIATTEDAKLMTAIREEPQLVFFAGSTFDNYECGEHVDIGTVVEKCSSYTESNKVLSKKSVATENYTRCKPGASGSTCTATRKEVGKVQHYEGSVCDKDKPVGEDKFYDWVCQ